MLNVCYDENTPQSTIDNIARYCNCHKLYHAKNKKSFVYNLPISFDTETTNYTDENGDKVGWLYIWMFRIGTPTDENSIFVYGRTTADLDNFLTKLSQKLGLNTEQNTEQLLYVYVHNFGFDIEFIRDKLTIVSELHSDKHNPIYVRDKRGFEFRDSLILSGGLSLAKIGKSLNNPEITKRVGDLDYNLIRTPLTELTETELGYCKGDVDVLALYIQQQIDQYHGVQHIPLTNTGRVRAYAKKVIYHTSSYGAYKRYRDLMDECQLTYEEYLQCQKAFYGGFTHANAHYVGKTLCNVKSYDFTSSYPTVMLTEKYPMGKPEHKESMTLDELRTIVNDVNKCAIFDLQLSNVDIKDDVGDCYLSGDCNKVHISNPVIDNGRVRSCDKIALTCTDVDFKIIAQCYDWENIDISNVLIWNMEYLPTPIIGLVLDLYNAKTTLKGVKGSEQEYQVKKGMLNSLYGMCVTRILRDKIEIDGDNWITIALEEEEKQKNIEKNNQSKTRFLYYPWGVFITSYARFNLWTAIKTLGDDYIYSDTDSIKVFADSPKLEKYLRDYQHDLDLKFDWMLDIRRKFSKSDLSPKTIDGIPKPIGVWDYEGLYSMFKTLGAKRYIKLDENGLYPTVAGISPSKLADYLNEQSNGDYNLMFDMFADNLNVPSDKTGKLASFYYKDVKLNITDYQGKQCHIEQKYGVNLSPVDFTLTMSGSFVDLIKRLQGVI